MKLGKLIRVLHRDISYFFTGMIILYASTGIMLNHLSDWNPYYIIDVRTVELKLPTDTLQINKDLVDKQMSLIGENEVKSYYFPQPGTIKIFVKDGTVTSKMAEGTALIEKSTRRPVFYELNLMHKNRPKKWWTWFSDIFAVSLIVITITGLCLVKGKNGITRRGAIWLVAGLVIPILAIFLFF